MRDRDILLTVDADIRITLSIVNKKCRKCSCAGIFGVL